MNAQISPKDWQLLSEYLDGQLSPRDQTKLEQRMKTQSELQHGLVELRKLRAVLRTVPRRKPPHNFTLTRAMVEKPVRSGWTGWVPALSFSSALATILLVISLVFQWPIGAPAAMVYQEEGAARMMAAQSEAAVETTQEVEQEVEMAPPIIIWGVPGGDVEGRGGVGGGIDPAIGMAAPEAPAEADPYAPPVVEDVEPPALEAAPKALEDAQAEPLVGTGPILGVAPVEEQGAIQAMDLPAEDARPVSGWLILQIGLGLIAAGAGITAYYLKRKAKA